MAVLVEAGANLLVRDHLGLTPLDLADKAEHAECMSVLRAAADKQVQKKIATCFSQKFVSALIWQDVLFIGLACSVIK